MKKNDLLINDRVICTLLGDKRKGTVVSLNPLCIELNENPGKTGRLEVVGNNHKRYFWEIEIKNVNR